MGDWWRRFVDNVQSNLEIKDILQIDATIITGILIFLTIGTFFEIPLDSSISVEGPLAEDFRQAGEAINQFGLSAQRLFMTMLTASIVTIFSISAIFALGGQKELSAAIMIAGFIGLMVNLWIMTMQNTAIAFYNQDRVNTINQNLSEAVEGRSIIVNETMSALERNPDVQDQLTIGLNGLITYCNAYPVDPGCENIDVLLVKYHGYCMMNDNRDEYCTDPTFLSYLREKNLIS